MKETFKNSLNMQLKKLKDQEQPKLNINRRKKFLKSEQKKVNLRLIKRRKKISWLRLVF